MPKLIGSGKTLPRAGTVPEVNPPPGSYQLFVNAATGSNLNTGFTALKPLKTLEEALKRVLQLTDGHIRKEAFVIIRVAAGTYAEPLDVPAIKVDGVLAIVGTRTAILDDLAISAATVGKLTFPALAGVANDTHRGRLLEIYASATPGIPIWRRLIAGHTTAAGVTHPLAGFILAPTPGTHKARIVDHGTFFDAPGSVHRISAVCRASLGEWSLLPGSGFIILADLRLRGGGGELYGLPMSSAFNMSASSVVCPRNLRVDSVGISTDAENVVEGRLVDSWWMPTLVDPFTGDPLLGDVTFDRDIGNSIFLTGPDIPEQVQFNVLRTGSARCSIITERVRIVVTGGEAVFQGLDVNSKNSTIVLDSGSLLVAPMSNRCRLRGGTRFRVLRNSSLFLVGDAVEKIDVSGSASGGGIVATEHSYARLTNVTGTDNPMGFEISGSSEVRTDNSVTITGNIEIQLGQISTTYAALDASSLSPKALPDAGEDVATRQLCRIRRS